MNTLAGGMCSKNAATYDMVLVSISLYAIDIVFLICDCNKTLIHRENDRPICFFMCCVCRTRFKQT